MNIIDYDKEYAVGMVIREACDAEPTVDHAMPRFYLTCSVGELAQRVVVALAAVPKTDEHVRDNDAQ